MASDESGAAQAHGSADTAPVQRADHVERRSFCAHSTLAAFDRRSLADGLKRCSAPWGVIPPTAAPISLQLAPWVRASSAEAWLSRSAARRSWSASASMARDLLASLDTRLRTWS